MKTLHAIISVQFASDPIFLAGWHAARRVGAKVGAVRQGFRSDLTAEPMPGGQDRESELLLS